jgi:hypothetical protein
MSRRHHDEDHFGSDSFLDVLANIVGILIILIVSAASRVQRGPELAQSAGATAVAQASIDKPAAAAPLPAEPDSDEPPAEITAELLALQKKMADVEEKSNAAAVRLRRLSAEEKAAGAELSAAEKEAAQESGKLKKQQLRLARLEEAIGERQGVLRGLLAEFEEVENARPAALEVKHRLVPVSQEVVGQEVYFRVSGGRVSIVPLNELAERIKNQLERQKDWLASRGHHEAVVGPLDGYSMKFEVERKPLSTLERNRHGFGAYRIGVSQCEIIPERHLVDESPEEALRRNSKFALAVKTAPEGATLTFWVYPDSFHAYRILQAACQAEGFVVAARPLPFGLNPKISPDGSRSAGQ